MYVLYSQHAQTASIEVTQAAYMRRVNVPGLIMGEKIAWCLKAKVVGVYMQLLNRH